MPSLTKLLSSYDIDMLNRIARPWQTEVESGDRSIIESRLLSCMTTKATVDEIIELLPLPAHKAWDALLEKSGRIPWSEFSRKHGGLRELGPAARERELPDQHPASATETLYYHGLIGRAFLDDAPDPREFAFIPDELASLFHDQNIDNRVIEVRPVPPSEIKRHQAANTRILDHVIDWLAALRMGTKLDSEYFFRAEISPGFIASCAKSTNLVMPNLELSPDKIGRFLQTDRLITLKDWFQTWKENVEINDLFMLPGLEFEGAWRNDPIFSRLAILKHLALFDVRTWNSLASFITSIKVENPEFLRSAGDFDSWSIRKVGTREYLAGRDYWDEVEGAYIKYLFAGPLHWLGVVDLAYGSVEAEPIAFRLSPLANFLLNDGVPTPVLASEVTPKLLADLTIVMPVNSSRLLRYQVGRFTKIVNNSVSETRFQISADSLTNAEKNGLKVEQLLQLLEKFLKTTLPTSYKKLAERWDQRHVEVKIEKAMILRLEDPSILKILAENTRTSRLIKETLTEKTILIDPAGMELIKKVLLEAGILSQIELDV